MKDERDMTPEEFEAAKRRMSLIAAGEFALMVAPFAIIVLVVLLRG